MEKETRGTAGRMGISRQCLVLRQCFTMLVLKKKLEGQPAEWESRDSVSPETVFYHVGLEKETRGTAGRMGISRQCLVLRQCFTMLVWRKKLEGQPAEWESQDSVLS